MKKLIGMAAVLLCSAAGATQVQTTTTLFNLVSGTFSKTYGISVGGPSTVVGDTDSAGISWSSLTLSSTTTPYSAVDANPDNGFSFSGLSAGNYLLTFSGSGQGGYGGYYTVTTLVPEPETYGLMLAGLAAGGFIILRRRK